MARPFDGIKVLDATHILAGPYCTYQLGLLGAAVIKVEHPREPDPVRGRGPVPALNEAGLGFNYLVQGANKRSLTLDLKTPQGKAVFLKLAADADVVVENWRAGAFPAMGLGYDDIRAINPDVVYCSLTAFGQQGPWAQATAYDPTIQAFSGIMQRTGAALGHPVMPGAARRHDRLPAARGDASQLRRAGYEDQQIVAEGPDAFRASLEPEIERLRELGRRANIVLR